MTESNEEDGVKYTEMYNSRSIVIATYSFFYHNSLYSFSTRDIFVLK